MFCVTPFFKLKTCSKWLSVTTYKYVSAGGCVVGREEVVPRFLGKPTKAAWTETRAARKFSWTSPTADILDIKSPKKTRLYSQVQQFGQELCDIKAKSYTLQPNP